MPAFNVVQKRRRAAVADRKRRIHGDSSGKLHQRTQPQSMSGKRKQKLLKKWRREQKEAVEKGLITMQDVEMAAADKVQKNKNATNFPMKKKKKRAKVRIIQVKGKNKNKKVSQESGEASVDVMVE